MVNRAMLYKLLFINVFLFTCSANNIREVKYQFLHEHPGTPQYEVRKILPETTEAKDIYTDSSLGHIVVTTKPGVKELRDYRTLKIGRTGNVIDTFNSSPNWVRHNGFIDGSTRYNTWIIDGDRTYKQFKKANLPELERGERKFIAAFDTLYARSKFSFKKPYTKEFILQVDEDYYKFELYGVDSVDVERRYPNRGDKRVEKFNLHNTDLTPDFLDAKEREENTDFMELMGYEEVDSEKGTWLNPIDFSGGDYLINLYMPGGDTIKFRRYGSMDVNLRSFKIPAEYGGRDDVVFITQTPNLEMAPGREWGGMYVVRPRGLGE